MIRLRVLALLASGLFVAGLAARSGPILLLAVPVIVFLAAAWLYRPPTLCLKIRRSLSTVRGAEGVPVEVALSVTNEGPRLEQVLLEDLLPPGLEVCGENPRLLTPLEHGQTVEWRYSVRGRRGSYSFPGLRATASDFLGLACRQVSLPAPGTFRVVPPVIRSGRVALRPQRTRPYSGVIPARRSGPGIEFYGVRAYQPGDPRRWINWRACARHPSALFTNEFQQECSIDVVLILDVRGRAYLRRENESLFESAVQATASLSETFLNEGNRVGLLLFGGVARAWTPVGSGRVQHERILRALATAEVGNAVDALDYLPRRFFPPACQIVLISPLLPGDVRPLVGLLAYGHRVLAISPDPVSFERGLLRQDHAVELAARIARVERTLLLRRLRQAGIPAVDYSLDQPFQQAVHRALGRATMGARTIGLKVVP